MYNSSFRNHIAGSCRIVPIVMVSLLATASLAAQSQDTATERACFELVRDLEPAYIVLAKTEHKGLMAAAKDLQRDVTKITGVTPNIVHSLTDCADKCVVLGSADCPEGKALLASVGIAVDDLAGKWETYKWRVFNNAVGKKQVLAIAGSNVRGTIFGVYDFEQKHLGVDPLWFWADREPPTRGELVFDDSVNFGPSKEPTWKYRGWTLNDHPIFMEWMESGLVQRARYSRYMFAIHHEVLQRLCEAALRLKMNMFTWYFIDIDWQPDRERLQAVADRGLFLTQQQMEGVGADAGFWDRYWTYHNPSGKPKVFSYRKHPEAFREFWSFYIKRWAEFSPQVVWEINLRGWADAPYEEATLPEGGTPQQRSEIISQALADQANLVRQLDPNPDLEMMTTLYNEQGFNYDKGWITVPEGVTTGFSDAGMSGMSYSKKFWTEKRDPKRKYGQYFHTQYFGGGPQIAKCTPIEQYLKVNMDAMFQRGDTQHMLLAMNHLRHQQIEIRGVAEMLWDYPGFEPREYLLRYCKEEFGAKAAPKVAALYDEYYKKHPHVMRNDGFKTIPSYHKVMEPLFTVNGNLQNIESGTHDGLVLNYRYDRKAYQQGIDELGDVLQKALALQPSIPEGRRYFFDYELIDAIRLVRGAYRLSIATNETIERLKAGDRKGALAALVAARPLVEEMYAAFRHQAATEKWQYWYRSGTNQELDVIYNLYQKARLQLEVDSLSFVGDIEPQRHPYLGNVVVHQPAAAGDAVYGNCPKRHNTDIYCGAQYSLVSLPLENAFQIGGVASVGVKEWKVSEPDYGLPYRFTLKGKATVCVAKASKQDLPWLAADGFVSTGQKVEVGHWGWPYRYRNRPPTSVSTFDLFAKEFPAGEVRLGKNDGSARRGLPYIVFVKPSLLLYENFQGQTLGQPAAGWRLAGQVAVVRNPDYDGQMRPSVFDLATVRAYRPLDLKSLELRTRGSAPARAEIAFRRRVAEDFVLNLRLKAGQADCPSELSIVDAAGQSAVTVRLAPPGQIVCRDPSGRDVVVAPYASQRWYNLTLEVSPAQRRYKVAVQDDQLNTTSRGDFPFVAHGTEPLAGLRLAQGPGKCGAWLHCDAVDAYER